MDMHEQTVADERHEMDCLFDGIPDDCTEEIPDFENDGYPEDDFDEVLREVERQNDFPTIEQADFDDFRKSDEIAAKQYVSEHKHTWTPVNLKYWRDAPRPEIDYLFHDLIPRGVVAGLAAAGGTGKSFLVLQLCLSLATGKRLLGSFNPAKPMKVMCFLGEDPDEITHARFKDMVCKYRFSEAEKELLDKNLKLYPHRSEPLVAVTQDGVEPTEFYEDFRWMVDEFKPDLLVLDPKSRWAILDENNNDQATRFVSLLEDLVKPFNGSVLVTHHVSKMKKGDLDASGVRGASAFVDAARVFFSMAKVKDKDVRDLPDGRYARVMTTKNNYGSGFVAPALLRHDDENGGVFEEVNPNTANLDALVSCLAQRLEGTDGINMSALKEPRNEFGKAIAGSLRDIDRSYKKKLNAAISLGCSKGQLTCQMEVTGGKPAERVRATK